VNLLPPSSPVLKKERGKEMHSPPTFSPTRLSDVPFYNKLSSYEWVKNFVKSEALHEQIAELRKEKQEINNLPCDKAEFIARLDKTCQEYNQMRLIKITDRLKRYRTNVDGFFINLDGPVKSLPESISCDEIIHAAETLSDNIGIAEGERQRMLEKIDKKLAKLSIELDEVSLSGWFEMKGKKVINDIREVFVEHWRTIQSQICEPCGPQGRYLKMSPDIEQDAWKRLELHVYLNKNARFQAYPKEDYRE